MPLAQFQFHIDRVGNLLAARHGILMARKLVVHFLRAAKIVLVAVHSHAAGIRAELAGVDAQHHVLSFRILAIDVVSIAGGHQRQPQLVGDVDGPFHRQTLDLDAVVHDLDEVAIAENALEPLRDLDRLLQLLFAAMPA